MTLASLCCGWLLLLWGSWAEVSQPVGAASNRLQLGHLGLEQGLSQSGVMALLQDRKGFLWLGTQDGLNRYDGATFKAYRHNPADPTSLSNNFIKTLYEDRAGQLWIGTDGGGLNRYDAQTDSFVSFKADPTVPGSLGANSVWAIGEDAQGRLWVGGYGSGLCRFDPQANRFSVYQHDPTRAGSLPGDNVFALYLDRQQRLWVGMWGGGLCQYDPLTDGFLSWNDGPERPTGLNSRFVYALTEDRQGNLWLATGGNGVYRLDARRERFVNYRSDLKNPVSLTTDYVFTIFEDSQGKIWVGTRGGGVCRYNPQRDGFDAMTLDRNHPDVSSCRVIRAFFQDRAGTLWIGTEGEGVYFYDPLAERFHNLKPDPHRLDGLPEKAVKAVLQDRSGRIWIGTWGGGLCRYDPVSDRYQTFRQEPQVPGSLPNDSVFALYEDSAGRLWVGTDGGGLCRYDPATERFVLYPGDAQNPEALPSNNIAALAEDSRHNLWVGLNGSGVCQFNPQTGKVLRRFQNDPHRSDSLSSDAIYALFIGVDDTIWVGTRGGGLCRYLPQTETFQQYGVLPAQANGLTANVVNALYQDAQRVLWIGTRGGGLNRLDPQTGLITVFQIQNGLPNDVINAIAPDRQGNLWLSTNRGIAKFDPRRGTFRNFDAGDGLQSNEFSPGVTFVSREGEIFFGGVAGVTSFHPEAVRDNMYLPPVVITDFKKFNQSVSLPTAIAETPELTLDYKDNFITFEFAALNFTNPGKNQYAYRLVGFDQNWIPAGTQRSATYTNLDGGTYVFQVKGSNNDGLWNEAGASIRLRVLPPPWKRWWAYCLYVTVAALGIWGGVRLQTNRVQAKANVREARLKAAAAEIEARAIAAENLQRVANEAEMQRKNQELNQKIRELDQANQNLLRSQMQADRIFSALAEALPGTVLEGKYQLGERIGSGGFGAVFRGKHLGLNATVAVKVFRPAPGNDSTLAVERFRLEGVSAARIQHPNAIRILDSGISAEGIAYLVMELLDGVSLADELAVRQRLSLRRAVAIIHPVCLALAEAHRLGIIHRDIKPANIFLHRAPEGEIVKLVDFGIAKMLGEDTDEKLQNLTATGGFIGTPTYMAPERLRGQEYDGRSDVYSLGVVLYEMLCGRTPYAAGAGNPFSVVVKHLYEGIPSLRQFNPQLPVEVETIILTALAKNPEERPGAKEFADLLWAAAEPFFEPESIETGPALVTIEVDPDAPTGIFDQLPTTARPQVDTAMEEAPTGFFAGQLEQGSPD
ncbi:MAG: protein kinase [Blastocatellia bacterium]|nr:protein kinase [Blastocatellia bacterium]